jgi:hypothetical protein
LLEINCAGRLTQLEPPFFDETKRGRRPSQSPASSQLVSPFEKRGGK